MEKERETIVVPKRSKNEGERYISCNGRRMLVKCGVPVEVPKEIAEVWYNSEHQRNCAEETIRGLSEQGA